MDQTPTLQDILTADDEPTAMERSQALQNALRWRRFGGEVAQLSGNPFLSRQGAADIQAADAGTQSLAGMPQARLKLAMEQRQAADQAAQQSPEAQVLRRALAKRVLPNPGEELTQAIGQAPGNVLQENLKGLEMLGAREEAFGARNQAGQQASQDRFELERMREENKVDLANRKAAAGVGASSAKADAAKAKQDSALDKSFIDLDEKLDPNRARSGELIKNQSRINAAKRVLALTTDEKGNIRNLLPSEMTELASSIAQMINSGGVASEHVVHEMTPETAGRNWAEKLQYWAGSPQGANQQEFVRRFAHTAERESATAAKAIHDAQVPVAKARGSLYEKDPERFRQTIEMRGLNLSDLGLGNATVSPTQQVHGGDDGKDLSLMGGGGSQPRADGKVRIEREGRKGWILPQDIKPTDKRI
jgi:hypothetical protein